MVSPTKVPRDVSHRTPRESKCPGEVATGADTDDQPSSEAEQGANPQHSLKGNAQDIDGRRKGLVPPSATRMLHE